MSLQITAWILSLGFVVSWICVFLIKNFLLKAAILDQPNERSSHKIPTPRGGGIGLLLGFTFMVVVGWFFSSGLLMWLILTFLILLMAMLGFWDDRKSLRWGTRLGVQTLIVLTALSWIYLRSDQIFPVNMELLQLDFLRPLVGLILLFYILWMVNLHNFMDGIDGLAASQAFCFAECSAVLLRHSTGQFSGHLDLVFVCFCLGSAALGFLFWNWQPAKIFLGDSGSLPLGFLLALLTISAGQIHFDLFVKLLLLDSVFIVDATYTLFVRVLQGKKPTEGHRSHAYQIASRKLNSHSKVTMAIIIYNFFYILPILLMTERTPLYLAAILIVSPLLILCISLKAGVKN